MAATTTIRTIATEATLLLLPSDIFTSERIAPRWFVDKLDHLGVCNCRATRWKDGAKRWCQKFRQSVRRWEPHPESCSVSRLGIDIQSSTMSLSKGIHDRYAETRAASAFRCEEGLNDSAANLR